jgi:hypothetical protein
MPSDRRKRRSLWPGLAAGSLALGGGALALSNPELRQKLVNAASRFFPDNSKAPDPQVKPQQPPQPPPEPQPQVVEEPSPELTPEQEQKLNEMAALINRGHSVQLGNPMGTETGTWPYIAGSLATATGLTVGLDRAKAFQQRKPPVLKPPVLNPTGANPVLNPTGVNPVLNPTGVNPVLNPAGVKPPVLPTSTQPTSQGSWISQGLTGLKNRLAYVKANPGAAALRAGKFVGQGGLGIVSNYYGDQMGQRAIDSGYGRSPLLPEAVRKAYYGSIAPTITGIMPFMGPAGLIGSAANIGVGAVTEGMINKAEEMQNQFDRLGVVQNAFYNLNKSINDPALGPVALEELVNHLQAQGFNSLDDFFNQLRASIDDPQIADKTIQNYQKLLSNLE